MTVAQRPDYSSLPYEERFSVMSHLAATYLNKPCHWFKGWELV